MNMGFESKMSKSDAKRQQKRKIDENQHGPLVLKKF